ncbi:MAG TPA: CoA transferase [Dehalococcoidia bacterium]|nr:CoA transferase [Dehalococcoidia bacterium]
MYPLISEWVMEKTMDEVTSLLEKIHLPYGAVNTIDGFVDDPQVEAREMLVEVEYPGIGKLSPPGCL